MIRWIVGLFLLSAALIFTSWIWPTWIELVVPFDFDGGSDLIERAIPLIPLAVGWMLILSIAIDGALYRRGIVLR